MGFFDHASPKHTSHFHINVNHEPLNWCIVVLMLFADVFLIILCLSLITPFRQFMKKSTQNPKCTVICSTITICVFSASSILITTSTILILLSGDYYHTMVINEIFTKAGLMLYLLSQTLLILLFNIRIDETFKGSVIQYSKRCIHSLYISTLLFFAFCILFIVSLIFELWGFFATLSVIWILLYLCLSIVLCVLFVRKIELLIVYCSGEYQLDAGLLHLVIKHAILVPICIGTSLLCLILFVTIDYAVAPGELVPAAVLCTVIDCTMSCIGIFLLFAWNNKYYNRFCGRLHYICEKRDILQLAKSHTKRVTKDRQKRSRSRTGSKTKSNRGDDDAPSMKSSTATAGTTDSRLKQESVPTAKQPVLKLVGSLRASLSNKKSSGKDKTLEIHLINDDRVTVTTGTDLSDGNISEINKRRLKLIEAIAAGEEMQSES